MGETDLRKWNRLMGFQSRSVFWKEAVVDKCLYCVHFVEKKNHDGTFSERLITLRRCALSGQRVKEQDICKKYREEKGRVTILE